MNVHQKQYEEESLSHFAHSAKYPRLTNNQRNVLFNLIRHKKEYSTWGEFQWCIKSNPPGKPPLYFVEGTRPVDLNNGEYDFKSPLYAPDRILRIHDMSMMTMLDRAKYITISDFREDVGEKETWVKFSINQLAFDYYRYFFLPPFFRFVVWVWDGSDF